LAYKQPNDEPPLFQSEEAIEAPSDWRIPPRPSGRGINRALVKEKLRCLFHFRIVAESRRTDPDIPF